MTVASRIEGTTLMTRSDWETVISRVVDAPCRLVFDAWTSAEHLPYWMLGPNGWPMPVCEIDLRPGGRWRFVWRRSDGAEVGVRGVYREVTPRERLVYTESRAGDRAETLNTLLLAEQDGKSTITYTVLYSSPEAREAALGTGSPTRVSENLDNLAEYLGAMA